MSSIRELSAFVIAEGYLRNLQIVPIARIGQCRPHVHIESLLYFIAAVFLLAGFVKGVVGLGLPTVSMGLLAVTMPPSQALAIVIVPAIITNIWQTFVGSYLRDIFRRLWPLLIGTALGIWLNRGSLTGALCALHPDRARHAAGDLCRHGPEQVRLHGRAPATKNGSAASSASSPA